MTCTDVDLQGSAKDIVKLSKADGAVSLIRLEQNITDYNAQSIAVWTTGKRATSEILDIILEVSDQRGKTWSRSPPLEFSANIRTKRRNSRKSGFFFGLFLNWESGRPGRNWQFRNQFQR